MNHSTLLWLRLGLRLTDTASPTPPRRQSCAGGRREARRVGRARVHLVARGGGNVAAWRGVPMVVASDTRGVGRLIARDRLTAGHPSWSGARNASRACKGNPSRCGLLKSPLRACRHRARCESFNGPGAPCSCRKQARRRRAPRPARSALRFVRGTSLWWPPKRQSGLLSPQGTGL